MEEVKTLSPQVPAPSYSLMPKSHLMKLQQHLTCSIVLVTYQLSFCQWPVKSINLNTD